MVPGKREWDVAFIHEVFYDRDIEAITQIPLIDSGQDVRVEEYLEATSASLCQTVLVEQQAIDHDSCKLVVILDGKWKSRNDKTLAAVACFTIFDLYAALDDFYDWLHATQLMFPS
ncbi:hypothetical protein PTKIN_Ptkin13bG0008500 [Pterospermum kingtungense]